MEPFAHSWLMESEAVRLREPLAELLAHHHALAQERDFLRNVIDLNPFGIQILDRRGRHFTGNAALKRLFSTPPPGWSLFDDDRFHGETRPDSLDPSRDAGMPRWVTAVFLEAAPKGAESGFYPRQSGWLTMSATPLLNASGDVEFLMVLWEPSQAASADAHESASGRETPHLPIRKFVEGLSRPLNSLLTQVMGFAELAQDSVADNAQAHSALARVVAAADRMGLILRRAKNLATPNRSTTRPFDLADLIRRTIAELAATAPQDSRIVCETDDSPCRIKGDPAQLVEMLRHLVDNAFQAATSGCRIRVTVRCVDAVDSAWENDTDVRPDLWAVLTVRDEGSGIAANVLPHIFDPFFTTRRQTGAAGLGLTLVRRIAAAHGGAVKVESAPGEGATFRVLLPCLVDANRRF